MDKEWLKLYEQDGSCVEFWQNTILSKTVLNILEVKIATYLHINEPVVLTHAVTLKFLVTFSRSELQVTE